MMRLIMADTDNGRSMAYLLDRTSLITCKGSTQNEKNLLQVNFRKIQPIKNGHGSLVVMKEKDWRNFAMAMNAKFSKESSDLIFWTDKNEL